MNETLTCTRPKRILYILSEWRHRFLHFCNPKFYHISHNYQLNFTKMPKIASASRLGHKFLEFFKAHHEDELECRSSGRFGTGTKHGTRRYHELLTDVNNALDDLLGLHGSDDGSEVIEIPKCMYEGDLCDLHHQICLSFVGRYDSEASENHRTKSVPPKMDPDLTFAGTESGSDREDDHGELFSSHECTDEMDQQSDDDANTDLNDASYNDSDNDSSGDSVDDDDDENELLSSDDPCDLAEYDKEEVMQKDQVSQRRRQLIKDDKDNLRTLVTVSGDDVRSQSMSDQMQSHSIKQASRMTPNPTDGHSSSAPFTPKNDASSLQHCYDSAMARRSSYGVHYRRSPGPRTLMIVTTISADPSCDKDVHSNEEAVRRRILATFASKAHNSAYGEEGFVYAFRDNELPFIKIGLARDLGKRKAQIEKSCGFVESMSLVAAVKVKAHKQLEQIIHQDLAPHRRFFDCACGQSRNRNGFTRHQEYFEIDDDAASSTLQLWADFVESLKPDWHAKMLEPSRIEPSETHESHEKRVQRWREFLGIPAPVAKIEKGTSVSPFILRSTARSLNDVPGVTESSNPDYTPSKPPRSAPEDIAEAYKPVHSGLLFSESPKRTFSSCEPIDRTHERNFHSTVYPFTFNAPYRIKDGGLDLNDTAAITTSSLQAKSSSSDTNVPPAGKQSSPFYAGAYNAQQNPNGSLEKPQHESSSAVEDLPSDLGLAAKPIFPKESIDRAPSSDVPLSPDLRSQPGDNPGPFATSGHTEGIRKSTDGATPATRDDPGETHRPRIEVQASDAVFLPSQKITNNATVLSASPVVQLMTELAKCLLAKEVRPLPARAISADIWQFRWPLACSIAFAIHSPHIPAGLSFLMWSIFLPFFVAELRGWAVTDQV